MLMRTLQKNKEALFKAGTKVGLEINKENAKYMVVSRHQNVGQNDNLLIVNKCFENLTKLGTTVTNKN
jgi:hypothetical protein